jgi:hypothetical protein
MWGIGDFTRNASAGRVVGIVSSWAASERRLRILHGSVVKPPPRSVVLAITDGAPVATLTVPGTREPIEVKNGRDAVLLGRAIARRLRALFVVRDN